MASALFQITAAEMQTKLVPRNGAQSFLIDDDDGDLTTAEVETILNQQEDLLLGQIDQRYVKLLRRVEGEVLTRCATDGQTSLQLGLFPATNLRLYRNLARNVSSWDRRTPDHRIPSADVSVDASGVVTLAATSALEEGDVVLAEYDHTGAKLVLGLRDVVMGRAAYEIAQRCNFFRSPDELDRFAAWAERTDTYIGELRAIERLDRLDLIFETPGDPDFYAYIHRMKLGGGRRYVAPENLPGAG